LAFPLNTLEADICDTLTARGIPLIPQYGVSKYRIDLVAQHPKRPGRLVLAIECDGASYHSAPTARDRDRLRQQHLEALGFRFHRIWSTDWFMRRDDEIARTITAFRAAVEYADRIDSSGGGHHDVNGTTPKSDNHSSTAREASSRTRDARPKIPKKGNVNEYTIRELITLIDWIESDGQLRTDEEIIDEMVQLLFHRRGNRIEAAVREAIRLWKGPRTLSTLRT